MVVYRGRVLMKSQLLLCGVCVCVCVFGVIPMMYCVQDMFTLAICPSIVSWLLCTYSQSATSVKAIQHGMIM